ncbi:MAG: hypothetical protein K9L62_02635 [Vallitaleaceae bacterium]|nr:hypothetical protein [Vallitaleaceae bacterium]
MEEKKTYSQSEIDRVHDTLTDLLVSTFLKYDVREEAKVGDWCIEISSLLTNKNRDCMIGRLLEIKSEGEYTTETIGGKVIDWHNAEIYKIPQHLIRCNNNKRFGGSYRDEK